MSDAGLAPATPVAVGIVRRNDTVLIRRRPQGRPLEGLWEFPGGKCETGETPVEAVVRECLEESGLAVVPTRLRRVVPYDYSHDRIVLYFFDCEPHRPAEEPIGPTGFQWVSVSELNRLRFPEANAAVIDELTAEAVALKTNRPNPQR